MGIQENQIVKPKVLKPLSRNFEASVPADLYAERTLPSNCIRLFCIIKQLHHPQTKFCTATNKTLGQYAGATPRTIQNYLKLLREAGFLTAKLEVKGDGCNRKFYRFLHVSNERIDTCRDIVRIVDDKENTKRIEDFENNEDADCEESNEAHDADTGEEIVPFEAQENVRQTELISPEAGVVTAAEPEAAENPKDIFEQTLWKHPETVEIIKERGSNKAISFKRWCKLTNNGKRCEVCDLLRTKYREMADARKRQGLSWNALEVFLNTTSKRWEVDWNVMGKHVSAFANPQPSEPPTRFQKRPCDWANALKKLGRISEDLAEAHANRFDWQFASKVFRQACKQALDDGLDWIARRNAYGCVSSFLGDKKLEQNRIKLIEQRLEKWRPEWEQLFTKEVLDDFLHHSTLTHHIERNSYFYKQLKTYCDAFESGKHAEDFLREQKAERLRKEAERLRKEAELREIEEKKRAEMAEKLRVFKKYSEKYREIIRGLKLFPEDYRQRLIEEFNSLSPEEHINQDTLAAKQIFSLKEKDDLLKNNVMQKSIQPIGNICEKFSGLLKMV